MKRALILLAVLTISIFSCKNDDDNLNNTCDVSDPVEDLSWLKEIIADIEQSSLVDESYVYQTTYKGQTAFIIGNCCALCNSVTLVAYCNGEFVFNLDDEDDISEYTKFIASNKDDLIWSSPNFVCNN